MNLQPPSPAKSQLICEFLRLTGLQHSIDEAKFFERAYRPGGPVYAALPPGTRYGEAMDTAHRAVKAAYQPHRSVWQRAYEEHVNWEFEEDELKSIVAFLASPAGQHYHEGRWRMDAYIETDTLELFEEIVAEACAILSGGRATR